jgi:hypothetical protein
MILWFIKISIISILLIIIVHHLFVFLQNNFSVPIVKDFVDINDKYQNMLNVIEEKDFSVIHELPTIELQIPEEAQIELPITKEEENIDMKNELKNFLKFEL